MALVSRTATATTTSAGTGDGRKMLVTARPLSYDMQQYAIDQERMRHDDAMLRFGEMTCFVLLWSVYDYEAGRVGHCSVCFTPYGDIAEAYQQPAKRKCPSCLGTTFEGGFRAKVYRPALWNHEKVSEEIKKQGIIQAQTADIQSTTDFELRQGDYAVRADGTRWQITQPKNTRIATGFGPKTQWASTIGSGFSGHLEDDSSVAYLVEVDTSFLLTAGWSPILRYPVAPPDVIRGPLLLDVAVPA